jgi:hypothetical protein
VILADSSAWIEYLRRTGSTAHIRVRELIEKTDDLATTEVVVMEVLAGARGDRHLADLDRMLKRCEFIALHGLDDFEHAADLYRTCRRNGETIRKMTDCIVASVAIRTGMPVLHADRDFEVLARHTPLVLDA